MTTFAQNLHALPSHNRGTVTALAPVAALGAVRPVNDSGAGNTNANPSGVGAGSSFSDNPFSRMLEQNRQAARLQARREQDRERPSERRPEPSRESASKLESNSASEPGRESALQWAREATPQTQLADESKVSDDPTHSSRRGPAATRPEQGSPDEATRHQAPHDTQAADAKPAASRAETALAGSRQTSKSPKLPPIATNPGELDPPEADADAPGASGVRRLRLEGPIECPVEPLHVQAVPPRQPAALQGAAAAAAHDKRTADTLGMAGAGVSMAGSTTDLTGADSAHAAEAAAMAGTGTGQPVPAGMLPLATSTPLLATASAQPPAQADLPAHPGSEGFGMQLSHQVSLWLRQGVTEARLNLNPADMGPIQIAIALDGRAAQVRMSAENALTRQSLEVALPALASTLAEAGFVLAGGGVFDQAQVQAHAQSGAQSGAQTQGQNPGHSQRESASGQPHHLSPEAATDREPGSPDNQPVGQRLAGRGQVDLIA